MNLRGVSIPLKKCATLVVITLWRNQLLGECIKNAFFERECNWLVAQCGWKKEPTIVSRCSVQTVKKRLNGMLG